MSLKSLESCFYHNFIKSWQKVKINQSEIFFAQTSNFAIIFQSDTPIFPNILINFYEVHAILPAFQLFASQ